VKNYAEMSDFDVNCAVAVASGLDVQYQSMRNDGRVLVVVKLERGVEHYYRIPNYCNNWADAGPVIYNNEISVIKCTNYADDWCAEKITDISDDDFNMFHCQSSFSFNDKNPLRAAMIVFLMMKDAEK